MDILMLLIMQIRSVVLYQEDLSGTSSGAMASRPEFHTLMANGCLFLKHFYNVCFFSAFAEHFVSLKRTKSSLAVVLPMRLIQFLGMCLGLQHS